MKTPRPSSDDSRISRRRLLETLSAGFGWAAFSGLRAAAAQEAPPPLAPRAPHHPARARRVIFLCMQGGPSQLDTFDYKPLLNRDHGRPARSRAGGNWMGSPFQFRRHGASGHWISELYPNLARHADRLCMVHSMQTDVPNHPQAFTQLHTGTARFVRPSMGSWILYGLGTENARMPGFVTIQPPAQFGARTYGSAFLPGIYQGTPLGRSTGGPAAGRDTAVSNIRNPVLTPAAQRRQLDLIQGMNRSFIGSSGAPSEIESAIESMELAFHMQDEVPRVLDLSRESTATLQLYGIGDEGSDAFGRQCLMARRLAEAGVRFIELCQPGWDQHFNLTSALRRNTHATDRPIAGLLTDLQGRGLLEDTVVLWGGEFGRTPDTRRDDGRDHNAKGFTVWLAGGGTRPGCSHGTTDDHGLEAATDKVHIHDLHATVLHLLGLDHERLTFRYGGREHRLTETSGEIVRNLIG